MDRIAEELGLSPIDVRRINLIQPEQMPYTTPSGNVYDSGDYPGLLETALEKIGYDKLREEQKRARDSGRLLGVSVVIGVEPGGRNAARDIAIFPEMKESPGSGGVNGAAIKLEKNGTIALYLGSPNCGQSHETTTAQVAADVLGIPPEKISISTPFDSDLAPWGVSAANSGNNFHLYDIGAVHGAATKLKEKILAIAAHVLRANPAELKIEDGAVHAPGSPVKKLTLAELGKIVYGNQAMLPKGAEAGLQATYYYTFPHAEPNMVPGPDRKVRAQFTFSAAAHAAVVEVDRETGKVHVLRYLIVGDNGTIIHPNVVNGQIYGSAAHGISVALGEGFIYNADGQLLTLTLTDYGKGSTEETPKVEIIHKPSPSPFTTLGQKAAGEGAAIPSPAAGTEPRRGSRGAPPARRHRQRGRGRAQPARRQSARPAALAGARMESHPGGAAMIPAGFEYFAPSSLKEAVELLSNYKDDVKILAGGQSLVPLMKLRLAKPKYVIDLNRIGDLNYIREASGTVYIGALATHSEIERSEVVRRDCRLLAQTAATIADTQVRNRGTLGGSLAHADPAGDLPAAIFALDAEMKASGPSGERWIKAEDFFVGFLTSALEADEILTEIKLPVMRGEKSAYLKDAQTASR